MLYSSINNEKIKTIKKLNKKKYRDMFGEFLVEGKNLVMEAYKSGALKELILLQQTNFELDIKTIYVTQEVLKYISELDNPSNIMGICKKNDNTNVGEKVVILEDIQDPGNLGTIIRSCVAFNVDTLILSKSTVDLYNAKVIRATQGMIFKINILVVDSLYDFIVNLKQKNYKVYSTDVKNGNNLKSIEKSNKFVIIMGNEGRGVSFSISSLADKKIYIEMNSSCESLNVGVATSIILYEFDK